MTDQSLQAAPMVAAVVPKPIEGTTVHLENPLTIKGAAISSLTLRKPIAADVIELSFPYLVVPRDDETCIEFRPKVVARYIARLAGIPMPSVLGMSIPDLQSCQAVIQGFFGRDSSNDDDSAIASGQAAAANPQTDQTS
jgi:hypothetical protein